MKKLITKIIVWFLDKKGKRNEDAIFVSIDEKKSKFKIKVARRGIGDTDQKTYQFSLKYFDDIISGLKSDGYKVPIIEQKLKPQIL